MMSTANKACTSVKYAKNAKEGDFVHAKGDHVSNFTLKHWFGLQASTIFFTGVLKKIVVTTEASVVGAKRWPYYDVEYKRPDGTSKLVRNKNIHHYPGVWVNPKMVPVMPIHGIRSTAPTEAESDKTIDPTVPLPHINAANSSHMLGDLVSELMTSELQNETNNDTSYLGDLCLTGG
jgi:hypothetical protein